MRNVPTTAAAVLLAAAVSAVGGSPAQAAAGGAHCWLNVSTGAHVCHRTFAEVISDLSGDRVRVGAGARTVTDQERADIAHPARDASAGRSTYVLGTVYADAGYAASGGTYTFTSSSDCDTNPDVDFQVSVMPTGWNDRISSFTSYGRCATKLWENTFSGTSYGFTVTSAYVGGAINDRTSSIQFN